jgi:5-methylthioadenosine/S-adenosylhomocysteine deaminase
MIRLFVSLVLLLAPLSGAEPADWIISARYVVTMDAGMRLVEDGAVAVRGARIAAVGPRSEIDRRFRAKARLDRWNAVVAPGLVNTHTHAAMSLLRGIADDLRLQDWLEKYIFPAEAKNVSPDFVRWGTRLGCLEMLLSGTTTFTDMYYFEDVVAEVAKEAGMRGVLGETIIGFPAPDAKPPGESLAFTEKYLRRFAGDSLVVPAVAPHALYTNSDETLRASRALANKYQAPLLIHVAETERERKESLDKFGMSPVRKLDALGMFGGRTVAAHCVWVDGPDRDILRERGTGVAHCPSSNMKLASGAAPVAEMLGLGIAVGLGPDGPAGSNNDFNLLEEMDLAGKLQKLMTRDPRVLPARQLMQMATILGARALGMDKEIGSLEEGKRADLITIGLDAPHSVPLYDVYSQLAYAVKGSDVRDVLINGRVVVKDRRVLTLPAGEILRQAVEYQRKILATLQ